MQPESKTVLHSWCKQSEWQAPTIVGGAGACLLTEDGRKILDMSSLAECSNLGHQHPAIIAAIKAQAGKLCFVTSAWGAQPRARLAELILEKAAGSDADSPFNGGRVFFTLGGADANEHGVKFARQASGKPKGKIIARQRSYHGASYAAMALSGDSRTEMQVDAAAFGVIRVSPPYFYRCPFDSDSEEQCASRSVAEIAQKIEQEQASNIAAVLMEANAGTNGIVPPDGWWPQLHALTRQQSLYLIADEVMSGFGRCGQWFAWQRYGAEHAPDIMSLAKGLTGAHIPLGAVVISRAVAEKLEHQMLYTGLTYSGHPLACAAGIAAIETYAKEQLIERSQRMGAQLFSELKKLQKKYSIIGDVRGGHGLFAVIELVSDPIKKTALAPWPEMPLLLKQLLEQALRKNVSFAARGNLLILAPPLVIGEVQLQDALSLLDQLLADMQTKISSNT